MEKSKLDIRKDGIISVEIAMEDPLKEAAELIIKMNNFIASNKSQGKILVDLSGPILGHIRSSASRKEASQVIKKGLEEMKFEKIALFGGDSLRRTIASFVLTAAKIDNIKVFEDKEDALTWLKE